MNSMLFRGGQAAGVLGMLLIVVAALARLAGSYTLGGYATVTLMVAGIAGVSVGCFLLLLAVNERLPR